MRVGARDEEDTRAIRCDMFYSRQRAPTPAHPLRTRRARTLHNPLMADAVTTSPLDEQSEKLFTLMDADGDGQLTETEGHIVPTRSVATQPFGRSGWHDASLDAHDLAHRIRGSPPRARTRRPSSHATRRRILVRSSRLPSRRLKAALRVHITSPVGGSVAARRLRRRLLRRRFRWVCRRSVDFV